MNKKLGMSNFQVGVLALLTLLTFAIIGTMGFFVLNGMKGNSPYNFSSPFSSGIVGKWEVISGAEIGALYEFFPDGTLSGGFSVSTYSYPDQTHLKIEMGKLVQIYEYTLSADTLTLTSNSSTRVLKRYVEIPISTQSVSGIWKKSRPDNSQCFSGLGIADLQGITLGADGSFSLQGGTDQNHAATITLNGAYFINENRLRVSASGIKVVPTMMSFFASSSGNAPTATPEPPQQLQGELDCLVTVSASRLNFIDNANQITTFARTDN